MDARNAPLTDVWDENSVQLITCPRVVGWETSLFAWGRTDVIALNPTAAAAYASHHQTAAYLNGGPLKDRVRALQEAAVDAQ